MLNLQYDYHYIYWTDGTLKVHINRYFSLCEVYLQNSICRTYSWN